MTLKFLIAEQTSTAFRRATELSIATIGLGVKAVFARSVHGSLARRLAGLSGARSPMCMMHPSHMLDKEVFAVEGDELSPVVRTSLTAPTTEPHVLGMYVSFPLVLGSKR
jgi:hypothetical protein